MTDWTEAAGEWAAELEAAISDAVATGAAASILAQTALDAAAKAASMAAGNAERLADLAARVAALEDGPTPGPGPWVPQYPGQPKPDTIALGGTTKFHEDPTAKYETPTGRRLSAYRSYATPSQWSNDSNLRGVISRDAAAGRIPVPSWKPPTTRSWADMAAGAEDAELDRKLLFLKSLAPVPVWAIFHHEPDQTANDGKGTPADHLAWNRHVRDRMVELDVINVALHLNLVGYAFNPSAPRSKPSHPRHPDRWYSPDVYDFVSVDPYARDLEDPVFGLIEDWMAAKDTRWIVAEWGYKKGQHGATRDWTGADVLAFYDRLHKNPLCDGGLVWDSDQNGDDYFVTPAQLAAIHQLMVDPRISNNPVA